MDFERHLERQARKDEKAAREAEKGTQRAVESRATKARYENDRFVNDRLAAAAHVLNKTLKLRRHHRIYAHSWKDVHEVAGQVKTPGDYASDYNPYSTIYLKAWTKVEGVQIELNVAVKRFWTSGHWNSSVTQLRESPHLTVDGKKLTASNFLEALRDRQ